MGNSAAIPAEHFEKMRAEFESKKGSLSDEELFNHMKDFYESLQAAGAAAATGETPTEATPSEAAPVETAPPSAEAPAVEAS